MIDVLIIWYIYRWGSVCGYKWKSYKECCVTVGRTPNFCW